MKLKKSQLNVAYLYFSGALTLPILNLVVMFLPLLSILNISNIRKLRSLLLYFAVAGYVFFAALNSSATMQYILCFFYLCVAISLRNRSIKIEFWKWTFVLLLSLIFIFLVNYEMFSSAKDDFKIRLRLFTPEASFFGSFTLIVSYALFVQRQKFKALFAFSLGLMAQSFLSLVVFFLIPLVRRFEVIFYILALAFVYYMIDQSKNGAIPLFMLNSGFIRLSGLLVLKDMNMYEILFGIGFGSSNEILATLLEIGRYNELPSFLFGFIADFGIIGFISYTIITVCNRKEFIILCILLFNFPPLFPICPILLAILRENESKA